MASIPCSFFVDFSSSSSVKVASASRYSISSSSSCSSSSSSQRRFHLSVKVCSPFLGLGGRLGSLGGLSALRAKVGSSAGRGGGARCWFKFGSRGMDAQGAGIIGSQSRDDFGRDDVEQYFNYMGMLAVEGTYDKMEALLAKNIHPVDILLLLAASEADMPKIEELMRAGAKFDVEDADGRTALDRAKTEEVRDFIRNFTG